MTDKWYTFSDFLGCLPTVRTNSYDHLLSNTSAQVMHSDGVTFHFIFTDVVRKGSAEPLELVEEDIQRRLYAERRADIVSDYEDDLRRSALSDERIKEWVKKKQRATYVRVNKNNRNCEFLYPDWNFHEE
jgi:hypothetical protein